VPAPLPGYLAALFVPFSMLSFPAACAVWTVVMLAATVLACLALAQLEWIAFDAALAASAVLVGTTILPSGELSPLAFAGVALVILGCARDRPILRIAGMLLASAEPQIALGVAAVLAARRRTLCEAAVVAVALAVVCVLAIGRAESVAYVRDVLPTHVASELLRAQQYTIPWGLAQSGVAAATALLTGRIMYALALLAAFLCGAWGRPAPAASAGAALTLAFGPFVHLDHLICALPAAALAARSYRAGSVALLALVLPVTAVFTQPLLVFAVPLIAYWVFRTYGYSVRVASYGALCFVAAAAAFAWTSERVGFAFRHTAASGGLWVQYVARHDVAAGALIWIVKVPVWVGLAYATVAACALAVDRERRAGSETR
jgi:hypothetical protein